MDGPLVFFNYYPLATSTLHEYIGFSNKMNRHRKVLSLEHV